jgi:hypothetical protein
MHPKLKSDGAIACAGWFCCLIGCVIFGGVLLSFTEFDDPWILDSCHVISRDDSCLDGTHENCAVSVKALVDADPVLTFHLHAVCVEIDLVGR